jgi:uncharacterized membrane protein
VSRKNRDRGTASAQRAELVRIQSAAFSGPLPPPEALERYNQTLPGLAERIIVMAESQHSHRLELEKHVIHSNVSAQKLGTVLGFVVAMTTVIGGIWLVHGGKSGEGLAAILTALASLVGVFVYSKREQQKDLARKTEAITLAAEHR